jgi:SAM-dependent methyltransferase
MGEIFKPESFDLIIANASLHHHADLGRVFRVLHALLESGGVLVVGDWHNSVWFYPGEVLRLLETFNWPDKGADLQRFRSVFITRTAPSRSSRLARANQQICEFWRAYARVRTKEAPRFSLLEGHRPADDYSLLLRAAGFSEVRCDILFEDSELLCVHCGARI